MKKTKPSIAAPGIPKNLLQEPYKLQNIRKTKATEQPRVCHGSFQNMKKTKPTVAAAAIPKNLCPRTFQTFKMEENKGYGAAPGMPRNLAKRRKRNLRSSRGYFEKPSPRNPSNGRSPGYAEEPSKT